MHHVRILRFYRSFSFYCTRDNLGHVNLDSSCLQLITSNPAFTVRRAFALAHASSPLTTTPICLCRALKILARGLSQLPTKSVTNVNIASGHSVLASIAAYSNATCTLNTAVAFNTRYERAVVSNLSHFEFFKTSPVWSFHSRVSNFNFSFIDSLRRVSNRLSDFTATLHFIRSENKQEP